MLLLLYVALMTLATKGISQIESVCKDEDYEFSFQKLNALLRDKFQYKHFVVLKLHLLKEP